jgi:anti-sigma factor ChrR (cupin superfamily)
MSRETDNLELIVGAGAAVAAVGMINAANALDDAVGNAIRERARQRALVARTTAAVHRLLADNRAKVARAEADCALILADYNRAARRREAEAA